MRESDRHVATWLRHQLRLGQRRPAHRHHRRRQDPGLPVRPGGQPHAADLAGDELLRHHHLRCAQPSQRNQGTGGHQPRHLWLRRPVTAHHRHPGQRQHHQLRLHRPVRARQPRPQPDRYRPGQHLDLHPQPGAGDRRPQLEQRHLPVGRLHQRYPELHRQRPQPVQRGSGSDHYP